MPSTIENSQTSGVRVPAGTEATSKSQSRDFEMGKPSGTSFIQWYRSKSSLHVQPLRKTKSKLTNISDAASKIPGADATSTHLSSTGKVEQKLEKEGKLPGLAQAQADNTKLREPGDEDAAGNKIHRKSLLKKMFHWEHNGMNAD